MSSRQHDSSLPLPELARSWYRSLRAKNLSPRTVAAYRLAVDQLTEYLDDHEEPLEVDAIAANSIRGYLGHVLDTRASATAHQRYASLVQLFRWLHREGEIESNPMERVDPPKVEEKPVPVLTTDELRSLLATCSGKDFEDVRDQAILRLFIDTGIRLGEMAGLHTFDVDLDLGVAVVRGKGNRLRTVPFGDRTTEALDRYERTRRRHRKASEPWLWLGLKGKLGDTGISQVVLRRGAQAGLDGRLHPHIFRHTFAHRWLHDGGSEGDLQRLAGWKSPQMLQRYGASAADERARDAHKRLGLGDKL